MARASEQYIPPDPTRVETSDEAIRYWASTLEVTEDKLRRAVQKAGPLLEDVKREIGSYGVG